ncbi:MAG: cysteine--tRNA ligase [Candidatus Aminicenantes bacterium]|nr:MAG: cysteine--tRNA ligase [Candidatus Aminicenantes bacterium]
MIKFFNTLSGKIEPFKPIVSGEVKLYTCGPTVYDYPHIGNFRAYIFEDLLKRFLVFMGYKVTQVMNITDVDDKTIRGANADEVELNEFTKKFIGVFFENIEALNISKADHYPRATEHIPEMAEMIKGLLEKGYAYKKDGSIYFSIEKFLGYGQLSNINLEELRPGQRIESDEYEKESAHDFALWKSKKENEPFWETEFGPGRPGWHIECSVMSSKYLGQTFDIHCGGVDNIFPHHENEIAQSEAYSGKKFVNYWLHCHHLVVGGEKMAKSKGNFYTMKDIIDRNYDPLALRLLLLSTHYRKMLNFTFEALGQSDASLQRIKDFLYELRNHPFEEGESKDVSQLIDEQMNNFKKGLSNDLNISVALTAIFDMIRKVNILISQGKVYSKDAEKLISSIRSFDRVLAVLPEEEEEPLPPEIMKKIEEREKARRENNYTLADEIRNQLLQQGIVLEDTKDGVRWKRK